MKRLYIPNLLSVSRIVLCLPLFLVDPTALFWMLYLLIGATDILDGFLARRWKVESEMGAKLDSIADCIFVITVGYKLFPLLILLPLPLWIMLGGITLVRIGNAISSYVLMHKIVFLHTKANKLTGLLLFIGIMAIDTCIFLPLAWVIACLALFASLQEAYYICTKHIR